MAKAVLNKKEYSIFYINKCPIPIYEIRFKQEIDYRHYGDSSLGMPITSGLQYIIATITFYKNFIINFNDLKGKILIIENDDDVYFECFITSHRYTPYNSIIEVRLFLPDKLHNYFVKQLKERYSLVCIGALADWYAEHGKSKASIILRKEYFRIEQILTTKIHVHSYIKSEKT